ncbi:MAG: phage replisome organizer N-terminal domain-containing protein [bacterium]
MKKRSVYISSEIFNDTRIKTINKTDRDSVIVFWFDLIILASKSGEENNLKNYLKIKKLPKIISNRTPEFINHAIETLEKADLLDFKLINNIVKFKSED